MKLSNKCMLITYADSLGNNLADLKKVLDTHLDKAVGGVHILPFFPSSADRGFAPMRYDIVDPDFGTWDDVKAIGDDRYLMFDFMINHISRQSPYFQDFLAKKDDSEFADFFIRYKDFWANEGAFPPTSRWTPSTSASRARPMWRPTLPTAPARRSGAPSARSRSTST